ncbi:hypothetical protein E3N88_45141 [Mikania micrantha]|uniref:Uncharacterized protein n=1 Tax=Mikania micrantha TaxID=192012 RepID=A0A5N6LA22_9ASTR|nr:hypothetical protein E3N88_45141 [Mikania micrantha]
MLLWQRPQEKKGFIVQGNTLLFANFIFFYSFFCCIFQLLMKIFTYGFWHLMWKNPLFKQSLQTSTAIVLHEVVTLFQEHGLVVEDFITSEPHKRNRSHYANLAPYGQFHVFLSALFAPLVVIIIDFGAYASVAKTTGKEGLYCSRVATLHHDELEHEDWEHGLVVEDFITSEPHKRNRSHYANLAPYGQFHVFLSALFAPLVVIIIDFGAYASVAKTTGKEGLYCSRVATLHHDELEHEDWEHGLVVEDFITSEPHKRNRSHYANLAPYGQFHVFLSALFAPLVVIIIDFGAYASVAKTTGKEGLYCSRVATLHHDELEHEDWPYEPCRRTLTNGRGPKDTIQHKCFCKNAQEHGLVVEDFITNEPHKRNRSHYANLAPYGLLLCTMMSWSMKNGVATLDHDELEREEWVSKLRNRL